MRRIIKLLLLLTISVVAFYLGCIYRFRFKWSFIFENSHLFCTYEALLSLVFMGIIAFIGFYYTNKFETKEQKALLLQCIFIVALVAMLYGNYFDHESRPLPIAKIVNSKKAMEICDFFASRHINTSIGKSGNYFFLISHKNYINEHNKLLIQLAENNLIDNNFAKDENFEFIKSKYYYDKNIDKPERLKKYVEREIKNQLKLIDGVEKIEVEFEPSEEYQNSKFIINIQAKDGADKDKIKKTTETLLSLYPGNKTVNF